MKAEFSLRRFENSEHTAGTTQVKQATAAGGDVLVVAGAGAEEVAREKGVATSAIEVWFADEARVGQKNKITRRWARRGTRPTAPQDQRTASTYIFDAICPRRARRRASSCPTATPQP